MATLLIQLFQASLPLNPAALPNVPFPLAFNTAVSFMVNTNWQAYSGESTLSYVTQMLALDVQNFLSAATGIAVLLALIRGLGRKSAATLGCFWVDLTRATLHALLALFIKHTGRVLTHRQILREVWGPRAEEHRQYLRVYVAHLRRKIEPGEGPPKLIVTESGVGYRLRASE